MALPRQHCLLGEPLWERAAITAPLAKWLLFIFCRNITGYGRELLESVRDELLENYEGVYLWVLRENMRARAFYEKLGFVPTEDACLCDIDGKTLTDIRYVYHK